MRLPSGSWNHALAFASLALVPAFLSVLLGASRPDAAPPPEPVLALAALDDAVPAPLHPEAEAAPLPPADETLVLPELADEPAAEDPSPAREPEPASEAKPAAAAAGTREAQGRLRRGQTIAQALQGHGVGPGEVHELVQSLEPLYDFRRAPAGAVYDLAWTGDDERLTRFCFRPDEVTTYEATRSESGELAVREIRPELRVVEAEVAARIDSSLYQAISAAGESPVLASKIADVFAWDLDFSRDQQSGDTFRMVVEKHYRGETFVDYGRVLAAEYAGQKGSFRAFWFSGEGPDAKGRYYLEDGRSAEKTFLATPVEFTRISSRFNKRRRHPILGFTKAHNGTDFAAPTGTPVRSMADGVVVFAGRKGPSGNLVVIDHQNGLKTYYAHLHSIAKSTRKGRRVSQKQLIGTVGSTGRSTGPHLHLGVKRSGHWVDPQALEIRRADPLPPAQLPAFQAYSAAQRARLASLELPEGSQAHVEEREQRLAALQLAALSEAGAL